MNIVEFLTARLNEDDDRSEIPHKLGCSYVADGDKFGILPCDCGMLSWWAADITAKRAIVEFMASEDAVGSGLTDGVGLGRSLRALAVLRHLASVYSDHPDYNPEWRS